MAGMLWWLGEFLSPRPKRFSWPSREVGKEGGCRARVVSHALASS